MAMSKDARKMHERCLTFICALAESATWQSNNAGWALLNDLQKICRLKKTTAKNNPTVAADFKHLGGITAVQ